MADAKYAYASQTKVYVANLPNTITKNQLEKVFGPFGQIDQLDIVRHLSNSPSSNVAFIRFNKREQADAAIAALHNVKPDGFELGMRVRAYHPRPTFRGLAEFQRNVDKMRVKHNLGG